ncbi:MAG: o-succinylbenzoate--CoA ligase [candidate division Zixibacteria bacterium]|nr:o-succinylbenzoate--CoA ligase [candidate division Zixibacteria bacterium]
MTIVYPTVRLSRYTPERIAAVDTDGPVTYGELEADIIRDAQRLLACGVSQGDRIAMSAANSRTWLSLIHAAVRIGAIVVPMNTRLSPSEIRRLISIIGPKLLLADKESAERLFVDDLGEEILTIGFGGNESQWTQWTEMEAAELAVPESVELDDICTIVGTSGSSGEPKLVALSYGNHYFGALASAMNLGHQSTDRWLINLPLYHVGGLSIVHRAAISGFAVVVEPHFDADTLWNTIEECDITHLSVVGTMLHRVLDAHGDRRCPDCVRAVLVGGGGTDRALIQAARAAGYPVLGTYGMTETSSQAATQSPSDSAQPADAARPLPMCDIDVRADNGESCAVDDVGQICIRGPMVADGYWQSDGSIVPIHKSGWLLTEDVGYLDTAGYLHVLGRRDDVIIAGGENVSLREIEQAAIQCTGVHRVAILAVEDPEWGQASVLFVEAAEPVQADTVAAFLRERLAHYKIPKRIICLDRLPTTALDKVDRSALYLWLPQQHES